MFKCNKCGKCCQNLDKNPIYQDLDSGNGVCIYFDPGTLLCTIYENRPLKCRVDDMYDEYYSTVMDRKAFYEMNYKACEELQNS